MTQYIDKSALVAEIKGYISNYKEIVARISRNDSTWVDSVSMIESKIGVLQHLLAFLNTLEVKEVEEEPVSNDLEEAARKAGQKYFPDECNIWARPNYEAKKAKCAFKEGAQWQKEQILGDDNKQYHRLRHETLKRLYENEAKLKLMLDNSLEGYIEKYEQIGGHNYLSLKIPMLSKPDDCKDGDKIKLIILKEE